MLPKLKKFGILAFWKSKEIKRSNLGIFGKTYQKSEKLTSSFLTTKMSKVYLLRSSARALN